MWKIINLIFDNQLGLLLVERCLLLFFLWNDGGYDLLYVFDGLLSLEWLLLQHLWDDGGHDLLHGHDRNDRDYDGFSWHMLRHVLLHKRLRDSDRPM